VDPGLTATGYGVVEEENGRFTAVSQGTVRPPSAWPLPERLEAIYRRLRQVIEEFDPQVVAVEEVYLARNAPAAMLTAQVLGVIKLTAVGRRLRSYAPREIKKWICGSGSAPKEQMIGMMENILGTKGLDSNHAADALAVAVCALLDGRP